MPRKTRKLEGQTRWQLFITWVFQLEFLVIPAHSITYVEIIDLQSSNITTVEISGFSTRKSNFIDRIKVTWKELGKSLYDHRGFRHAFRVIKVGLITPFYIIDDHPDLP